ncbi:hypothetical protein TNCV_3975641 [Trichonephila clavipes]|nr:hypothetical protein TNCV_2186861 [Trichonephila clavipes]GFX04418.1 hypothetical protein TNCV_3975641 [Trichonephila clavipes]
MNLSQASSVYTYENVVTSHTPYSPIRASLGYDLFRSLQNILNCKNCSPCELKEFSRSRWHLLKHCALRAVVPTNLCHHQTDFNPETTAGDNITIFTLTITQKNVLCYETRFENALTMVCTGLHKTEKHGEESMRQKSLGTSALKARAGFKLRQLKKDGLVETTKRKNFQYTSRSHEHNEFERKLISNIKKYLDVKD